MSASFQDERIGRFNDAVKSCSSLGGVALMQMYRKPFLRMCPACDPTAIFRDGLMSQVKIRHFGSQ
jgi:hypothetical protein